MGGWWPQHLLGPLEQRPLPVAGLSWRRWAIEPEIATGQARDVASGFDSHTSHCGGAKGSPHTGGLNHMAGIFVVWSLLIAAYAVWIAIEFGIDNRQLRRQNADLRRLLSNEYPCAPHQETNPQ